MKRVLWAACLLACVSGAYAADSPQDTANAGKARNEAAYERSLEDTGWKSAEPRQDEKQTPQQVGDHSTVNAPAKSG